LEIELSNLVVDSWQQGRVYVISSDSKVIYGYSEDYIGDWKAMDKALNACGVKLSINYHTAIDKWLTLRREQPPSLKKKITKYYLCITLNTLAYGVVALIFLIMLLDIMAYLSLLTDN